MSSKRARVLFICTCSCAIVFGVLMSIMASNDSDVESSSPGELTSSPSSESDAQSTPSSSNESDAPARKKRRTAFQPRSNELTNISRSTFMRWEARGILVPRPSDSNSSTQSFADLENTSGQDIQSLSEMDLSTNRDWFPSGGYFHEKGDSDDEESRCSESESDGSGSAVVREDSDSDSDSETQDSSRRLFSGSPRTTEEAVLMLLELYLRNNWSKASLEGTLVMLATLLPQPNTLPKTKYMLLKYVEEVAPVNTPVTVYYYCATCLYFVGPEKKICDVCSSKTLHQFYGFSVEDQVKYLFEKRNLADLLDKHGQSSGQSGVISDINCGAEYRRVKIPGRYSITLLWNTDGVSMPGGSSEAQFWPVQYVICELPYHLRKQFMTVCIVWFDACKPPMNTLLKPFVQCLCKITEQGGVTWTHPVTGEVHQSSVIAPVVSADAPARADVQQVEHPTSLHGCNLCEQKREPISKEEADLTGSKVRPYFTFQEQPAELRTNRRMNQQGLKAAENQRAGKQNFSVLGVKGPAIISIIPSLDRATCVYPEYMHGVCLGVVLQFIKILFFSSECHEYWKEGVNFKDQVDSFLLSIRPSEKIRNPRKISKVLKKKWRAHEYRAWLLYFSLPAFAQNLKHKYAQHWILLVISVFSLLKGKVREDDLNTAESCLTLFVKGVKKLYGTAHYSYNLHQLLHLPLVVKRWGPLWATSAFAFEDSNRILSNLVHGPNKKAQELVINLKICQAINVLRMKVNKKERDQNQSCKLRSEVQLNPQQHQLLLDAAKNVDRAKFFSRATVGSLSLTSKLYVREEKKNNFTVVFDSPEGKGYGEVDCYIMDNQNDAFALVSTFTVDHTKIFFHEVSRKKVSHIVPVQLSTKIKVVKVEQIKDKLVRVGDYVCHVPNAFENIL